MNRVFASYQLKLLGCNGHHNFTVVSVISWKMDLLSWVDWKHTLVDPTQVVGYYPVSGRMYRVGHSPI